MVKLPPSPDYPPLRPTISVAGAVRFSSRPIVPHPHTLLTVDVHRQARRNLNVRFGSTFVTSSPVLREQPVISAHFLLRTVASRTRSPSLRKVASSLSSAVSPDRQMSLPVTKTSSGCQSKSTKSAFSVLTGHLRPLLMFQVRPTLSARFDVHTALR